MLLSNRCNFLFTLNCVVYYTYFHYLLITLIRVSTLIAGVALLEALKNLVSKYMIDTSISYKEIRERQLVLIPESHP